MDQNTGNNAGPRRRLESLSRETRVLPTPVSDEFLKALRQADARSALIDSLERERQTGKNAEP